VLGEGYEIVLRDITGRENGREAALLELRKDGNILQNEVVAPGDSFSYEKNINGTNFALITASLDSEVSILDGFIKFRTAKDVYRAYAINASEEIKSYEFRGNPATNVDATGDIWFKVAGSSTVSFSPLITSIQAGESHISTAPLPDAAMEDYLHVEEEE
jgi:hypothetical protein